MFVVLLTYVAPLEAIDAALPDHAAWLDRQFADGVFVAAGRREPRTGGTILAHGVSHAALEELLGDDPFATRGLATYEVVEFLPSRTSPELQFLAR